MAVLSRGADAVYLFNYFQNGHPSWTPDVYRETLRSMRSLDSLLRLPRSVGITYRDITGPGEAYQPPLPASGKELAFRMRPGPIPEGRATSVLSGIRPRRRRGDGGAHGDGQRQTVRGRQGRDAQARRPRDPFRRAGRGREGRRRSRDQGGAKDDKALTVQRVEMSMGG